MSVPSYDEFIYPLLQTLHEYAEGLRTGEAYERVATRVGLSDEEKQETLASGQATYKNRIGWAHDRLKRKGYSSSPEWGHWQLTDEGHELADEYPDGLPEECIESIKTVRERDGEEDELKESSLEEPDAMTPDERIDVAVEELYDSVSDELLELIHQRDADFFEQLVLDLLHAAGYGVDEDSVQHSGKPHDGGIDGVISLDRLGLEKVFIQAKRYKQSNPVRVDDVRAFAGTVLRNDARGVFLTTSYFTHDARSVAAETSKVRLVNGEELTELMEEYGVGVRTERVVRVVEADRDYFEES